MTDVDLICEDIEAYLSRLLTRGFDVGSGKLPPQSSAEIAAIEPALGVAVGAELGAFLSRGLRWPDGSIEEGPDFAGIGLDWLSAKGIVRETLALRMIASEGEDGAHAQLINAGLALTAEQPQIVVSLAGVYHFSFRNDLLKVAESFGAFLRCWRDAGCFGSHSFDLLERRAGALFPPGAAPSENSWVTAYKRQYAAP
jgi:hypothetical protein